MMRWVAFVAGVIALGVAWLLGGGAPFGRVALSLGAPDLAARIFVDPQWRGAALFEGERYDEAAIAFAEAGPNAAFNRGNAQTRAGEYAAALEAYDLAMAYREDLQAKVNFDLVLAFYAGTRLDPDSIARWGEDRPDGATADAETGQGTARASGTGDEVTNTGATIGVPALQSREQRGVRKVFDEKFIVASPRWLATLEDVPGAFLAARISHEYKRRKKAGEGQPEAASPW